MTGDNKIEIPLSKSKLSKLLVFSVLFLIGGLWMIITNPQVDNPLFDNIVTKMVASYGSTIMGLLGVYYFAKKLFDKEPGFILDEQGIYDNATAMKFGLIPWSDISGIYATPIRAAVSSKQHFITIGLVNPDKYISREPNFLKRKLLEANARSYGSPIQISANGLQIDHKALLDLVMDFFEKHKQPHLA